MRMRGWWLLLAAGCGGGGALECDEGWEALDDETCAYVDSETEATPDLQAFLDGLECSEMTVADEVLDLDNFCVGAVCVGDDLLAFEDAFGAPDSTFSTYAFWDDPDLFVGFVDVNGDGVLDKGEGAESISLGSFGAPFAGTTDLGLGLGTDMGCWVQELRAPDLVTVEDRGAGWSAANLTYLDGSDYLSVGADGAPNVVTDIAMWRF